MRCSFCGVLDLHGTHHPSPDATASVCLRCLAAIDAGLRGAPPGDPYPAVAALLLCGRTDVAPTVVPLDLVAAPCAWCGRPAGAGVPLADMLGAVSLCAPCAGSLRQRAAPAARASHYRQSAARHADGPAAPPAAIESDRYRLQDGVVHSGDPTADDALSLADCQGFRVRAWSPAAARPPWEGTPGVGPTLLLGLLTAGLLRLAGFALGHSLRLIALGLLTAFVGATVRRTLLRRSDELRLELLRPDGTTFLLAVDNGAAEPAALIARHAPVLTAALAAMGRTPCPRFVDVPAATAVRLAADDRTSLEPSPAASAPAPVRKRGA